MIKFLTNLTAIKFDFRPFNITIINPFGYYKLII